MNFFNVAPLTVIRSRRMGSMNSEQENTLNQILTCMDGLDTSNNGVIVMGATNRFELLDPALLRSGRFDRIVQCPLPDRDGRNAILLVHTKKLKLAADVDLDRWQQLLIWSGVIWCYIMWFDEIYRVSLSPHFLWLKSFKFCSRIIHMVPWLHTLTRSIFTFPPTYTSQNRSTNPWHLWSRSKRNFEWRFVDLSHLHSLQSSSPYHLHNSVNFTCHKHHKYSSSIADLSALRVHHQHVSLSSSM